MLKLKLGSHEEEIQRQELSKPINARKRVLIKRKTITGNKGTVSRPQSMMGVAGNNNVKQTDRARSEQYIPTLTPKRLPEQETSLVHDESLLDELTGSDDQESPVCNSLDVRDDDDLMLDIEEFM